MNIKSLLMTATIGLIGLTFSTEAEASFCEGAVFTPRDAAQKLTVLNASLVRKDEGTIMRTAGELEANLPCMKTPAPPQVFAQAYRYIGLGHFYRGDADTAARWFRSALELSPNHQWGVNEIDVNTEVFRLYEDQRDVADEAAVEVIGMDLQPPDGTIFYLDGRPLMEAKATTDRPHILFIASATDRHIISRFLVDGNQFPQQFLVPTTKDKKKKKDVEVSSDDMFAVQTVKRVRPKSKTPLLVSSATTMAIAAGVYGYTYTTNAQFYATTSLQEKNDLRALNNGLIIAAGALGVTGLGVGYAGVIVDANPVIPWQF